MKAKKIIVIDPGITNGIAIWTEKDLFKFMEIKLHEGIRDFVKENSDCKVWIIEDSRGPLGLVPMWYNGYWCANIDNYVSRAEIILQYPNEKDKYMNQAKEMGARGHALDAMAHLLKYKGGNLNV